MGKVDMKTSGTYQKLLNPFLLALTSLMFKHTVTCLMQSKAVTLKFKFVDNRLRYRFSWMFISYTVQKSQARSFKMRLHQPVDGSTEVTK